MTQLELKYGCNPNQKPARIFMEEGELPLKVLNGKPGYINFMDALNSWQLVKALKKATGLPAAASFKHVSPAGAALGLPLSDVERRIYFAPEGELSPIACAYIRARGADRLCSFGDWAALSDVCDGDTARFLAAEVSDGVIAPGYTDEALDILKAKRKGGYNVVEIDPNYEPAPIERRNIFGITFEQGYNSLDISEEMLQNIVTENKDLPQQAKHDMLLSLITLKYTQSNSVCYVKDGMTIGVGAGQQSRIHCTRPVYLRRVRGRAGRGRMAEHLPGEARGAHRRGEGRLDRPDVRGHCGLRCLLPLWGQRRAGPEVRRAVHRPARRLHPGRSGHRHRQQVRHGHGVYRDSAVPSLIQLGMRS